MRRAANWPETRQVSPEEEAHRRRFAEDLKAAEASNDPPEPVETMAILQPGALLNMLRTLKAYEEGGSPALKRELQKIVTVAEAGRRAASSAGCVPAPDLFE